MGSLVDGLKKTGAIIACFQAALQHLTVGGGGMERGVGSLKRHFLVSGCLLALHLPLPIPCKRPAHQRTAAMRHVGDVVTKQGNTRNLGKHFV